MTQRAELTWSVEQSMELIASRNRYRAELWRSPYNGEMLAATRWTTKAWAARDGQEIFGLFGARFKRYEAQP